MSAASRVWGQPIDALWLWPSVMRGRVGGPDTTLTYEDVRPDVDAQVRADMALIAPTLFSVREYETTDLAGYELIAEWGYPRRKG